MKLISKKFLLSVALVASVIMLDTGCKKDAADTVAFAPLTTGTNWTYKYTEGNLPSQTLKLTVTGRDTVANGKTYKVISSSDGSANTYMGKSGNDYYRFAAITGIGVQNFEELYLKDNENVNGTWSSSTNVLINGTTIPAQLLYTVKGKGESRTVNQVLFKNVTHIRLDISAVFVGTVGGGDFYYQEGVGMIESNIAATNPLTQQTYTSTQQLVSYEIK
ncbi:MAG TPA: hypothetical protein VF623_15050 [Segetibacter sp.]|jgi:hypothetical protein